MLNYQTYFSKLQLYQNSDHTITVYAPKKLRSEGQIPVLGRLTHICLNQFLVSLAQMTHGQKVQGMLYLEHDHLITQYEGMI